LLLVVKHCTSGTENSAHPESHLFAELTALSSRTPADFYALLAQRATIDVDARLAAPTFILPDDVCDAQSGRLIVHLGNLRLQSLPDDAEPIRLPPEWPPRFAPTAFDGGTPEITAATSAERARRQLSAEAESHHTFDAWTMELSNVSIDAVSRVQSASSTPEVTPVLLPVSTALQLQASFLPLALNPEALRLQAQVSRIAGVSSLALAQRMVSLQRLGLKLLNDITDDAAVLSNDPGALPSASAVFQSAASSGVRELTPSESSAVAPASIFVDFSVGQMSLSIKDVRRVVHTLTTFSSDGNTNPSASGRLADFPKAVAAVLELEHGSSTSASDVVHVDEFAVYFAGLRTCASLSRDLVHADVSLRSLAVLDKYQRSGADFERFVDSDPLSHDDLRQLPSAAFSLKPSANLLPALDESKASVAGSPNPLVRVKAELATSACPELRVELDANTLQVGFNPETVTALQWYLRFLLACMLTGMKGATQSSSAASSSTIVTTSTSSHVAEPATPVRPRRTSLAVDASTPLSLPVGPHSQAPAVALAYVDQIQRFLSPPLSAQLKGDVARGAPSSDAVPKAVVSVTLPAAPPLPPSDPYGKAGNIHFLVSASVLSLGVTLHKERQRSKIAHIAISNVSASARSTRDDGPGIEAELSLVKAAVYTQLAEGSMYPRLAAIECDTFGGDALTGSGTALRAHFQSWDDPLHPRFPGHDSALAVKISALQLTYLHQPVLELIDYAQRGVLGSLLAATASQASAAVMDTQARDTRMVLDAQLESARVLLPANFNKLGAIIARVGRVSLQSCYCQPPERLPEEAAADDFWTGSSGERPAVINKYSATVCGLAVLSRSNDSAAEQAIVTFGSGVVVDIYLPFGAAFVQANLPSADVAALIPAASVACTAHQLAGIIAIVDGNFSDASRAESAPVLLLPDSKPLLPAAGFDSDYMLASLAPSSLLGIVYTYGAPPPSHEALPARVMRVRVRLPDAVTLCLLPSDGICPPVICAVRRAALGVIMGRESGMTTLDADFSELSIHINPRPTGNCAGSEVGLAGATDVAVYMLRPVSESSEVHNSPSKGDGNGFSASFRQRSLLQHVSLRVSLGGGGATVIEAALRRTEVFPSLKGLAAVLTFVQGAFPSTTLRAANSNDEVTAPDSLVTRDDSLGTPLPEPPSVDAHDVATTDVADATTALTAPRAAATATPITIRVLVAGVTVLLSADCDNRAPGATLLASTVGAEVTLELTPSMPLAVASLRLLANVDLAVSMRLRDSELHNVLRDVRICADVTVLSGITDVLEPRAETRAVELKAGLMHLTIAPALLRTVASIVGSFTESDFMSLMQPKVSATPVMADSVVQRQPSESSQQHFSTTLQEHYSLHWEGLAVCMSQYDATPSASIIGPVSNSFALPAPLAKLQIGSVSLILSGHGGGRYSATGGFEVTAAAWIPEPGTAYHSNATHLANEPWQPLFTQPWVFETITRLSLTTSTDAPAVSLEVSTASPLCLSLCDKTVQMLMTHAVAWQSGLQIMFGNVAGSAAKSQSEGLPSAPRRTPAPGSSIAVVDSALWSRTDALSLRLQVPFVSVELTKGLSTGATASLVSVVIADLQALYTSSEFRAGVAGGSGHAVTSAVAALSVSELHVFDNLLSLSASESSPTETGAEGSVHLPSLSGMLVTSTPSLSAAALRANLATGRFSGSQARTPRASSAVWSAASDAVDSMLQSATPSVLHTPLISVLFSSVSPSCPDIMRKLLSQQSADIECNVQANNGTGAFLDSPACVRASFDTIHAEVNSETLAALLRYAIVASDVPLNAAVVPITSASTNAAMSSEIASVAPPTRRPPSSLRGIYFDMQLLTATLALNSGAQRRRLAFGTLQNASVHVELFQPSSSGVNDERMIVRGSLGRLIVRDALIVNPAAEVYANILAPMELPLSDAASADATTALVEFYCEIFGRNCDVTACTVVTATLLPVRVVYIAQRIQNILSVVTDELLVLTNSSTAAPTTNSLAVSSADSPMSLAEFVAAGCPIPPSLAMSINVRTGRAQIILPSSLDGTAHGKLAAAVVAEVGNVSVVSQTDMLHRHAASIASGMGFDATVPIDDSLRLPVSVLRICVAGVRIGAKGPDASRLESVVRLQGDDKGGVPAVVLRILQPVPVPAWVAAGFSKMGRAVAIAVPPLDISMNPSQLAIVRHVIDGNVAAPPITEQNQRRLCSKFAAYMPEPSVPKVQSTCSSCRRQLGGLVADLRCDICGESTCLVCLAEFRRLRVYDAEAGSAKQSCMDCWSTLAPKVKGLPAAPSIPDIVTEIAAHSHVREDGANEQLASLLLNVDLPAVVAELQLADQPLARVEAFGIRFDLSSDASVVGRSTVKVSVSALTLVDARPSHAAAPVPTSAARVILAPNWRELQRFHLHASATPTPAYVSSEARFARERSHSNSEILSSSDGASASFQPNVRGRPEDDEQTCQIFVSLVSYAPTGNSPSTSKLQLVLNHCDVNPDPAVLVGLAAFSDGYDPSPSGHESPDTSGAHVSPNAINDMALAVQKRSPSSSFTLSVSLNCPRILLLEHAHRPTSRVLLLALTESSHITLRSEVDLPKWRLIAEPVFANGKSGASRLARCRSQVVRSAATLVIGSAELLVSHLVPAASDRAGLTISSDRVSLVRPFSLDVSLQQVSSALLSVGCNPLSWEHEQKTSSRVAAPIKGALSAAPDPLTAVASTLDPATVHMGLSVSISPIRAILAYTDGLLVARVLSRLSKAQEVPPNPPTGAARTAIADSSAAKKTHVPSSSTLSDFLRLPSNLWHPCDYEVRVPQNLELGLTVLGLTHPSLTSLAESGHSAAAASADVPLESAEQRLPPQYIEHLRSSSVSPRPYDCGEGVRLYAVAAADALPVMQSGDVLLSVNGQSIGGLTREATVRVLQQARAQGPMLLRLRSMPLSMSIRLQDVHITLVNDAGGRDDPLLDVQVGDCLW
jgi:hypothetical protein